MPNLFSRGEGGRHDWMRFHADNVTCPDKDCCGNLLWSDKYLMVLWCDLCHKRFKIKPIISLNKNLE